MLHTYRAPAPERLPAQPGPPFRSTASRPLAHGQGDCWHSGFSLQTRSGVLVPHPAAQELGRHYCAKGWLILFCTEASSNPWPTCCLLRKQQKWPLNCLLGTAPSASASLPCSSGSWTYKLGGLLTSAGNAEAITSAATTISYESKNRFVAPFQTQKWGISSTS